jgi:glycosyltransferase involved in cell wall biosynthesis
MKLLYTNFHSGSGGGHTTYIRELARALGPRHEVHVAAPAGSRLLAEAAALPGVHTLAQPFPNGLRRLRERAQAIRQLRDYLRAHRFDIVHVNGSADHRIVIAALRGVSPRPRVVLTKHNTKPMGGLQHVWRARFHTDKAIAVCEYVRRQLEATPYRVCHPQTVYNGVDTTHFAPWPDADARMSRERFAPDAGSLLIGSSAGTADYKGWTDLVAALGLLSADERRRVHVLIAGQPPSARQLAIVREAGLEAQFHFSGLLEDVRPVIAALDAGFVLSHDIETISFACREMMAMGKPVMVTDYAGLPENLHPGEDGWVVPVHGHEAMATTLRGMLRHRDALAGMGAAARAHALAEFGIARFADATEAVYRDLLVNR